MSPELTIRVPGRVNLIGEHTDYNEGLVLPMAVDLSLTMRARPAVGEDVRLRSLAFSEEAVIPSGIDPADVSPPWARYAAAVLLALGDAGLPPVGFEAEIGGDLPVGAGLSSSAALSVGVALAAIETARRAGREVPPALTDRYRLAVLASEAEATAAGVRCGIMDPFVALHAVPGAALLLDCRSIEHRPVAIDSRRLAFVVADTTIARSLENAAYGRRREECERAAAALGVSSLRGVDPSTSGVSLPEELARRVRHVGTENQRVLEALDLLEEGDLESFGEVLDASHESLRVDYEVSCPELDRLVEIARTVRGVYGSRMTGAGFGGSTVTAVAPEGVERLIGTITREYPMASGRLAKLRIVTPAGAARVMA
ncbi:MAG: galactokinase, partial [Planctomycetota bacterium]